MDLILLVKYTHIPFPEYKAWAKKKIIASKAKKETIGHSLTKVKHLKSTHHFYVQ